MDAVNLWREAWALLTLREKRTALIVLGISAFAALASAAMVASVMPFLLVLAEPKKIHEVPVLQSAYARLGFLSDFSFLVALGGLTLGVIALATAVQVLRTWAINRFSMMRMHSLSRRLLSSYLSQPYEFFLVSNTGELSTQILSESQQVVTQFFRPAAEVISGVLTATSIVALLLWIDVQITVSAFFIFVSLYVVVFLTSSRKLSRLGSERIEANKERFRLTSEALGGVKYIKLTGREGVYLSRFDVPARKLARAQVAANVLAEVPQYVMQGVTFGGGIILALILLSPASLASGDALGTILPLLGVFAFAGQRIMPELARLYRGIAQIQFAGAAISAVHADLNRTAEPLPAAPPQPLRLRRCLEVEGVSYRYPTSTEHGLHGLSFEVAAGETVGLVGKTGAGKTTLGDVLLGLLAPSSGQLIVDGTPIRAQNTRAWQQSVSYVPQEIFLTDATVAENIAFGVPLHEINLERVRYAAAAASIDEFVRERLPDGYNTRVGERGVRLSGGQRQRLGIARALYAETDLILFDEATSALDSQTERRVIAAIQQLPGKRTIIMIAHRLTTLKSCDKILVLRNGILRGSGTWEDLQSNNEDFIAIAGAAQEGTPRKADREENVL